ncbi:MAG: heme o synthase [Chromatiaceae bacterium]
MARAQNLTLPAGLIPLTARWQAYLRLCKLKVVYLIVFTAVVGMFLATPGMVPWDVLLFGTLGIGLSAASAAAFNHVLDRNSDALMGRTHHRPLPRGEIGTARALAFATVLGVLAMAILTGLVNGLTALLSGASLIGYALVYTVFLKRATPENIVIGGVAGAAPPVLGWTAVTGSADPNALLLFLIIFAWTPPHFWALAIARREEYAKVNIPMLPVTHGVAFTKLQILLYTLILTAVTLLPVATGMSGLLYLIAAVPLDLVFLVYAVRLYRAADERLAMRTFGYSILYLSLLFTALLADHFLGIGLAAWR